MDNYNNYYQGGDQNQYNPPVQEQKPNSKIWLWILIPFLIIIIGVVVFYFINSSPKTISSNEFSQGVSLQLKENKEANFMLDDQEHTIKVNSVGSDSVNLIIQSNPLQVNLKIGEEKKFDLDNDGFYDIQVKLNSIENGVPEIYIKKIHESTCTENWNCGGWSSCSEQGSQTRTCNDLNSCGTTKNKPATTQSCTYTCVEDWSCTDWSSCTSGQQTRTCTNSNSCGITTDKPNEQQSCALETLSCGNTGILIDFSAESIQKENENNYNCFANRIEACQKTSMTYNIEFRGLLGVNQKYSHFYELKGMQSGKCELYVKMSSYDSFSYTDSVVQSLLDSGMSQEEIDQQAQEIFEGFQQLVDRDGICKYSNPSYIKDYFNDFSEGTISFSTEDEGLPNADECSGLFFEPIVG